jgi:hypothetical protein
MEVVRKIVSADKLTDIVDLPWSSKDLQVELIIIPQAKETKPRRVVSVESMAGCLREYANPALWEKEKHAWEEHVIEKYGNI